MHRYTKLPTTNNQPVQKIYHFADIHIRLDTRRHAEYKEVFSRLYDFLRSERAKDRNEKDTDKENENEKEKQDDNDNSIIVLCGDILHSKTELSPECIDLTMDFFKKLVEIMDVILIMGNHDGNLSNKDKLDSLSPLVKDMSGGKHKIFYLLDSGAYEYKNLVFGVTSILDDRFISASDIKTKTKTKIALYHGAIHSALTDVGHRMNSEEFTVQKFKGYHYVMLGDIHRYQYLDEKRRVCYPGSLIQQNHGESVGEHGLVKWDLVAKTSEFIRIENDYVFLTLTVRDGVVVNVDSIPKKGKKLRIRLLLDRTTRTQYLEVCKVLKSKYDVQEITYSNVAGDESESEGNSVEGGAGIKLDNINDTSYQNELMKKYMAEQMKLNDKDTSNILKLNEEFNKSVKGEGETKHKQISKWKLKELKFSNMFCYGEDNKINFEQFSGGKVVGLLAPNHSGKSALLDIILFTLFEKCSRGSRLDLLNERKEFFYCQVRLDIDGTEYVVQREAKYPKKNAKNIRIDVDFWKKVGVSEGEGEYILLNGKDRNETNKIVAEYVGCYDDYVMTSFCLQKEVNFLELAQCKKKDFLMRLLKLDIFETLLEHAKGEYKDVVAVYNDCQAGVKDVDGESLKSQIEELVGRREGLTREYEKGQVEVDRFYEQIDGLNKSLVVVATRVEEIDKLELFKKNIEILKKKMQGFAKKCDEGAKLLEEKNNEHREVNEKLTAVDVNKLTTRYEQFCIKRKKDVDAAGAKLRELYGSKRLVKAVDLGHQKKLDVLVRGVQDNIGKLTVEKGKLEADRALDVGSGDADTINKNYTEFVELGKAVESKTREFNNIDQEVKMYDKKLLTFDSNTYNPDCQSCITNMKDVTKVRQELNTLKKKRDLITKELKKLNTQKQTLANAHASERYESMKQNEVIDSKIQTINLKLELFEKDLQMKQTEVEQCKTDLLAVEFNKDLERKIQEAEKEVRRLNETKMKEYDDYIILKETEGDLTGSIKDLKINLLNDMNNKRDVEDKISKYTKNINDIYNYNATLAANDTTNKKITSLKIKVRTTKETLAQLNTQLGHITTHLANLEQNKQTYEKQIAKLAQHENKKKMLERYIKLVCKDGLPYTLFNDLLNKLQHSVNNILMTLTDFSISFELTDDNSINIYKNQDVHKHSVDLCSGFEKAIINVALRIMLTQFNGIDSCNCMILDESFISLDADNRGNLDSLFGHLRTYFDFVIVISHGQELKGLCDEILNIRVSKEGFSSVMCV